MGPSKIASVAALVGGVAWLANVGLIWGNGGENTDGGLVAVSLVLGIVALGVAVLAGGYSTVTTAPLWLRMLVSLAALALGWIVFASIDSAAKGAYAGDGWLGDELGVLICAVIALIAGTAGLLRSRATAPPASQRPGHRAAR
jgi:hypothetical protein